MPRKSVASRVVGPLLHDLRTARGFSQEALASRAGLHRTYISLLERSLRDPTVGVLSALLEAMGVSWAEFGTQLDERRRDKGGPHNPARAHGRADAGDPAGPPRSVG